MVEFPGCLHTLRRGLLVEKLTLVVRLLTGFALSTYTVLPVALENTPMIWYHLLAVKTDVDVANTLAGLLPIAIA